MQNRDEVTEITSQVARLLSKRGGEKVKQKGKEYMTTIAKRGGMKTRRRGKAYYAELGRKSALKRWGKQQAG